MLKKIWFTNPIIVYRRKKYKNKIKSRFDYNNKPTILSSNCIAGIIYSNLDLQFNSPTINLFMTGSDFIKFVTNIQEYTQIDLELKKMHENGYPICKLDDIEIVFNHYRSFEDANEKWKKRINRINYENLYVITHVNGLSNDDFERFNKLKVKRKIMFSHKNIPGISDLYVLPRYKKNNRVGKYAIRNIDGFRDFEKDFDYVTWLNGGELNEL